MELAFTAEGGGGRGGRGPLRALEGVQDGVEDQGGSGFCEFCMEQLTRLCVSE
jgi:hypothetical protein